MENTVWTLKTLLPSEVVLISKLIDPFNAKYRTSPRLDNCLEARMIVRRECGKGPVVVTSVLARVTGCMYEKRKFRILKTEIIKAASTAMHM